MYKYLQREKYLFDILENRRLYFNSFRNYNDPYEIYTFVKDKNTGKECVMRDIKDKVKACCFSAINNCYLLWSHYGRNHRGFCIEFDFSNYLYDTVVKNIKIMRLGKHKIFCFPVEYSPYELEIDLDRKNRSLSFDEIIEAIRHKYAFWDYEKEIRLAISSEEPCQVQIPKESIKSITFGFNVMNKRMAYVKRRIENIGYTVPTKRLNLVANIGQLL